MSGKYGVGSVRRGRSVENNHGKPYKEYKHHAEGSGPPSSATDDEVMMIRMRQNLGEHPRTVFQDFKHIGETSFRNIWEGITRAYIFPK